MFNLRKNMTIILGITVLWWTVIGLLSYFFAVGPILKHHYAKQHFSQTRGTILSSEVKSQHGGKRTVYRPEVAYSYNVAGKDYVGDRYDFMIASTSESGYAHAVVSRNPVGRKVAVFYNPASPAQAVLSIEVPRLAYTALLFVQPFAAIGLGLIAWCVMLPGSHRRLQQFLEGSFTLPWRIPTWGTMSEDSEGLTVQSRRKPFAPLGYFLVLYGLACFVAVFIVIFKLGGFTGADPRVIRNSFIVAAGIGLLALIAKVAVPAARSNVVINPQLRILSVRSRRRDVQVPLMQVKSLRLRQANFPKGLAKSGGEPRYLLIEAVTDRGNVPIHAFRWLMPWQNRRNIAIASKVQAIFAELMRVPTADGVLETAADDAPLLYVPSEAASHVGESASVRRKGENYEDLL